MANSNARKGEKPKRRTIKVEIPVPHVPVRSALRKGAGHVRKGGASLRKKISGKERRAWGTPGGRKGGMSRKELVIGTLVVAAVLTAIVLTRPGTLVVQQPGDGSGDGPFGYDVPQLREKISFDEYTTNYLVYGDRQVSLQGFLRNRVADAPGAGMGVYEYYIVDDYGSQISLMDLGPLQRSLFQTDATTPDLYNVTGIVKVKYAGFDLRVLSIEKS